MQAVEVKIWRAIRARIRSFPPRINKAWPAEPFSPPRAGDVLLHGWYNYFFPLAQPPAGDDLLPYLRIGSVTASPAPVLIGEGKRHIRTGTLIVTLVHPILKVAFGYEGDYLDTYDEAAGQIAQHFAEGTQMRYDDVCVKVVAAPHVQPGYLDNGYWTVPVSIPWRTFA